MNIELLNLFSEFMEKQEVLSKLTETEKLHCYSYSEIHTITSIGKLEMPNVTAIANHLKLTRGAVSKITKRLSRAGLIETYMIPENNQKIFFRLTDSGKELFDEHEVRHGLWLERDNTFLNTYSNEEIIFIMGFMKNFNDYLKKNINELGGDKNAD